MRIYLGGPINGCTDQEAHGWRDELKPLLEDEGHVWVDPMRRDYRGREMEPGIAEEIVTGDIEDIDSCDVLIMNCPTPSVGTSMEMFYAYRAGKVVIAVVPEGKEPSPWLVYHSTHVVRGSAREAVKWLKKQPALI